MTFRINNITVGYFDASTSNLIINNACVSSSFKLSALNAAPSSATDTGSTGDLRVTSTHIYVCTATNTWVRSALATW